jgi:hypothetical protein
VHTEMVRACRGRAPAVVVGCFEMRPVNSGSMVSGMTFILWLIAVVLVVSGIVAIFRSQLLWGIVLIVVGLLVGPGGVSMFS